VFLDILEILFLGLASALWPLLLVVVVIALNTSRPVRILGWFLVGGLLTTISIDTALVFALQGSSFLKGPKPSADGWVDIVVGVLALLAALVLHLGTEGKGPRRFQPKPKSNEPSRSQEWIEGLVERGATLSFVAGVVATILPAPFAIIAMKNIAELDISDAQAFALIVVFNLLMFIMVEVPLVGFLVAPEWARRTATGFNRWLGENLRAVAIYALAIAGSIELVRGVVAALT
jgi:Sap, sulfolipid-1-addressing protein